MAQHHSCHQIMWISVLFYSKENDQCKGTLCLILFSVHSPLGHPLCPCFLSKTRSLVPGHIEFYSSLHLICLSYNFCAMPPPYLSAQPPSTFRLHPQLVQLTNCLDNKWNSELEPRPLHCSGSLYYPFSLPPPRPRQTVSSLKLTNTRCEAIPTKDWLKARSQLCSLFPYPTH